MSDHIVSYWTQFRRDKNGTFSLNYTSVNGNVMFAYTETITVPAYV